MHFGRIELKENLRNLFVSWLDDDDTITTNMRMMRKVMDINKMYFVPEHLSFVKATSSHGHLDGDYQRSW